MSENAPINPSKLLVVLTSLPSSEAAKAMARALVEQNLAPCVQLTEGIHSIYRWEGKICEEQEVLLSAKTTQSKWLDIVALIQEEHPYDLPEVLAFSPEVYEKQYGKWVESEVNSSL